MNTRVKCAAMHVDVAVVSVVDNLAAMGVPVKIVTLAMHHTHGVIVVREPRWAVLRLIPHFALVRADEAMF